MSNFADIIPQLEAQMGISSLEYLPVAINQSRYYGLNDLADWFEKIYKRLTKAVEEEHNAEEWLGDANTT